MKKEIIKLSFFAALCVATVGCSKDKTNANNNGSAAGGVSTAPTGGPSTAPAGEGLPAGGGSAPTGGPNTAPVAPTGGGALPAGGGSAPARVPSEEVEEVEEVAKPGSAPARMTSPKLKGGSK